MTTQINREEHKARMTKDTDKEVTKMLTDEWDRLDGEIQKINIQIDNRKDIPPII